VVYSVVGSGGAIASSKGSPGIAGLIGTDTEASAIGQRSRVSFGPVALDPEKVYKIYVHILYSMYDDPWHHAHNGGCIGCAIHARELPSSIYS
jgi:hypothetical protein